MLSPPDADLVRRDRQLPGLGWLLDSDKFGSALVTGLALDADVQAARLVWVSYSPGQSCIAGYQVECGSGVVDVCARAYRVEERAKLWKDAARPSVAGPLGGGRVVWEDPAVLVSVFPNDPRLRALPRLADPAARARLLRHALPDRQDLWDCDVETLRYKPEQRYVARLVAGSSEGKPAAKVKVYGAQRYRHVSASGDQERSTRPLQLARVLGRSDRHRVLVFEWLHGSLLQDLICRSDFDERTLVSVGTALAQLHRRQPDGLPSLTRETEAITLLQVAAKVAFIRPPLARRSHELAGRLAACISRAREGRTPIHGDFYAEQLLVAGNQVAVIDLDQAARGDPALDLGLFIAHLECDVLHDRLARGRLNPLRAALLEGYRDACDGVLPSGIEFYTAVGLLRLAVDPFRNREPAWPERLEAILARAEALIVGQTGADPARQSERSERGDPRRMAAGT